MANYRLLIVYQRAVEYDQLAVKLIAHVRRFDRSLASHLTRSGNSMLTAIAEGAAADQPKMKAASYRNGKREAEECDVSWEKAIWNNWAPHQMVMELLAPLDEVVKMLAQLITRWDPPT